MYGRMPRLEHSASQFLSQLSQQLRQENVSPEQVGALSKAVASLPQNARLTSVEVDSIAERMQLTAPHKATLIFALLLHRYPELKKELSDKNAMSNGLAGMLDELISKAQQNGGDAAANALQKFFLAFAGSRSAVEESGLELFKQSPSITVAGGTERVAVQVNGSMVDLLEPELRTSLALTNTNSRYNIDFGSFEAGSEGGWVFTPFKQGETQGAAVALGRIGVQALEHLSNGLSAYIGTRSNGQQHVVETEAMEIAKDIGVAGTLLAEVMRLKKQKNDELGAERSKREGELRTALGDYRVARIGAETVNALVHALFPEVKK